MNIANDMHEFVTINIENDMHEFVTLGFTLCCYNLQGFLHRWVLMKKINNNRQYLFSRLI
jgi:hypothetical protein